MTELPEFNPSNTTARNIEDVSLLGPFFKLSVYPDSAVSWHNLIFKSWL